MLEYTLEENKLTGSAGQLRAQVVNVRSYTQNDIIDRPLHYLFNPPPKGPVRDWG